MDRRSFLRRSVGALVGITAAGRYAPSAAPALEIGFVRESKLVANDHQIFASGGLCAPVTPYYKLEHVSTGELMPAFRSDRGGILYVTPPELG